MKILSLFLTIWGGVFLISSCGSQSPPANSTNSQANNLSNTTKPNNQNSNIEFNSNKTMTSKNDTLSSNIDAAIDEWLPEHEVYSADSSFMDLWIHGTGFHPEDFPEKGAKPLIAKIKQRDVFKNCKKAQKLTKQDFEPTGDIKTVADLNDKLYYCVNS